MTETKTHTLFERRTQGPWRLPRDGEAPDAMVICAPDGGSIGDTQPPGPWMSIQEAEANAAFIVHMENHWVDMLKALEFYADPFAWKKLNDPQDLIRIPDFYSEMSFGGAAAEALAAAKGSASSRSTGE